LGALAQSVMLLNRRDLANLVCIGEQLEVNNSAIASLIVIFNAEELISAQTKTDKISNFIIDLHSLLENDIVEGVICVLEEPSKNGPRKQKAL
jgi:hypothetical protein